MSVHISFSANCKYYFHQNEIEINRIAEISVMTEITVATRVYLHSIASVIPVFDTQDNTVVSSSNNSCHLIS